jgi:hypothetical protein
VRQASPAAPRCRNLALRAAVDLGIADVLGIDGVDVTQELLHVEKKKIEKFDLSKSFNLRRRFDVALCLEVAEHLPEGSSDDHMSSIAAHSDTIFFSAASPGQPGDHHVNYQWPTNWQCLFNKNGFACHDSLRWQIWDDTQIQPWCRQRLPLRPFVEHRRWRQGEDIAESEVAICTWRGADPRSTQPGTGHRSTPQRIRRRHRRAL